MNTQAVLDRLHKSKSYFFQKYPLKSMALFGSHARNEATEQSDVDILVEFSAPIGFEFIDLAIELEDVLQTKVDLVSKKGLKAPLLPYIEKNLIYV
ncbi:nucleotidyltransferase family protein [Dyadobacter chenwenxiniae]|uniref:Nucleotidyltransferase family protein n=1 Tax=Dyadobacter chenwenxiniae TaxID=2906456 RepID=A0A9X1PQA1_9BACT|nr:nucleotidyltransferase family protein [Dyadobacter chenwenxiniae]MCF0051352.1 nucleotidyltransferase family protein [Dyadobacter chenwenxiniae]MCF0065460.1 nucleotidyltransferase family protein [Dyadobacter chenwenxiniae]UON82132.1 nucleotidyltransferase family protein [Dyadobacter chenwenxiniae]